jgi:hypothetical protein
MTAEGLLVAVPNDLLLTAAGVREPDDIAIELPRRLVIAPRSWCGTVVRHHPARAPSDANGPWRTRLLNAAPAVPMPEAQPTPPDTDLTIRAADQATAGAADSASLATTATRWQQPLDDQHPRDRPRFLTQPK